MPAGSVPDEFPHELLDAFRPIRLLGVGGMGRVFLVEERSLGRTAALKLLRDPDNPRLHQRFEREVTCLARIRHPAVVRVFSAGRVAAGPYLVMEYLEGRGADELKAGDEVLPILLGAAGGLDAIHAAGLVHRDLKPANIMVCEDGRAVLIDLGLIFDVESTRLTRTGTLVGTAGYMAPEVLRGEPATDAADTYSWGITLFALLERRLPYDSEGLFELLKGGNPPSLVFERISSGSAEARLIRGCLALDPRERPADREAMEALLGKGDRSALPPERTTSRSRPAHSGPRPNRGETTASGALSPLTDSAPEPAVSGTKASRHQIGGRVALVLLALTALLALGIARPDAPTVPTAPSMGPEADVGVLLARLRELRQAVQDDERVRGAIEISPEASQEFAMDAWQRGQRALRKHLLGNRDLFVALGSLAPSATLQRELAPLRLMELLLSGVGRVVAEPLYQDGEDSGVGELQDRNYETWTLPIQETPKFKGEGRVGAATAFRRERLRRELTPPGTRWEVLRNREDLPLVPTKRPFPRTTVRLQTAAGETFDDPLIDEHRGIVDLLGDQSVGTGIGRSFEDSPAEVVADLSPVPDDLYLVLQLADWGEGHILELELRGAESPVRLSLSAPPVLQEAGILWFLVRVPAAVLPGTLRTLRVRAVGVQRMGDPSMTVNVHEIYQLVAGDGALLPRDPPTGGSLSPPLPR